MSIPAENIFSKQGGPFISLRYLYATAVWRRAKEAGLLPVVLHFAGEKEFSMKREKHEKRKTGGRIKVKKKIGSLLTVALVIATAFILAPGGAAAADAKTVVPHGGAAPVEESAVNKNGPPISGQEALKIVRAAFPYLPAEGEPRIDLEEDTYRGRTVWRIDAEERPSYRPVPPPGYHATVDAATGEILEMHWRPAPPAGVQEIKGVISREKARAVAESLARRLQPEKFARMTANPSPSAYLGYGRPALDAAYHFSWSRTHDGIPVGDDGLHISVDAVTGLVTGYTLLWREDIKLSPAGAVLPAGEVPAKVAAKAGTVLVYAVFPGGAAPAQVRPVYQINSRYAYMVDARTGDFLNFQGEPVRECVLYAPEDYAHIGGEGNPPVPGAGVDPLKAREAAERFFRLLGYEGPVERSGSGVSTGPLGRRASWYYALRAEGQDGPVPHVGVDSATGEVVEFHDYAFRALRSDAGEKRLTREEALAVARDFIRKVGPACAGHVALEKSPPEWRRDEDTHSFRFFRVVNGIPFPTDGIEVEIAPDGRVVGYRCEWHRVNFPRPQSVISPAEAARRWVANASYELKYYLPRTDDGRPCAEARLVYFLREAVAVDAVTGQVLGPDGRPLGSPASGYDFRGSQAADYLQLLAESGLLPPPEKFAPSAPVTRREAVRALVAATRRYYGTEEVPSSPSFRDVAPGDPDFGTVETAVALCIVPGGGSFGSEE
ncbi:MAG TPA: hypothetical protein DCL13_02990, partial [Peptococcaceae bacterium]|nr:hypothetical protein [Peptococcaceae bacterium]